MPSVIYVNFVRVDPTYEDGILFVGIFSTLDAAERHVATLRPLEGFKDHPGGFMFEKIELDVEYWNEGFATVKLEGADEDEDMNPPPWVIGETPQPNETAENYALRLCDRQYGMGQYRIGVDSEFREIIKYRDWNFRNLPSVEN